MITHQEVLTMYGLGHRYCPACGHAVLAGRPRCGGCSTPFSQLMLLDAAMDDGLWVNRGAGIGFDPWDGQVAVGIPGTDLAIEPGTGQVDVDLGGIDVPLDDLW